MSALRRPHPGHLGQGRSGVLVAGEVEREHRDRHRTRRGAARRARPGNNAELVIRTALPSSAANSRTGSWLVGGEAAQARHAGGDRAGEVEREEGPAALGRALVLRGHEERMVLPSAAFEQDVMRCLTDYLGFAAGFDIEPPCYVFLADEMTGDNLAGEASERAPPPGFDGGGGPEEGVDERPAPARCQTHQVRPRVYLRVGHL